MPFFRLKHSFTSGELSPLMNDRVDFDRFRNGCKSLKNMVCATQGPAVRRPGLKFIFGFNTIGFDNSDPKTRLVPFIFNELQSYVMIFYNYVEGDTKQVRIVFGTTTEDRGDGLVLGRGIQETLDLENIQEYTGDGSYYLSYPANSTVNTSSMEHINGDDGTRTDVTDDCTIINDPTRSRIAFDLVGGPAYEADRGDQVQLKANVSVPIVGDEDLVTLVLPDGWDIDNFDWAQSGDEMYIAQPGMKPHIIRRWSDTLWEVVEVTFDNQPAEWSDDAGWPETVTFHQQRLVFAANKLYRQTVWMTQAGDFSSFARNSPLEDSDGVTFTLDSGTQNKIQWMASGKSLHIGTLGNEWTVSGNDRSALTPSNILAQRQTNSGSEKNKPLLVGLTTLFIERHGRAINEFVYDYTFDSYKTSDMSILAPHLTKDYSITDWTYQQTPDSIIWCVREDGDLLGITYQRQHKVVGWHHHDTQGYFKNAATIPGITREDDVWVVVQRENSYYVEKMVDYFNSDSATDARFLDNHYVYGEHPDEPPTDTITGITHLDNQVIDVLADGTVHPPVTVTSNGVVNLNGVYSIVVMGFGYESEIRPLLMDAANQDGSSRGRTQRITNVAIDLYKSLGMYVGRYDQEDDKEEEEEIPFRVPSDRMDEEVPLFTGWKTISYMEGFCPEADYFIRQKQPLPLTVRAVVDEVEVHGL